MRPVLITLLMLGFIHQHFVCCCEAACTMSCHNCAAENTVSSEDLSAGHRSQGSSCVAHHQDEESTPIPLPAGNGSGHEHHVCVGSHIFFVTSGHVTIDFSPQNGPIAWLPNTPDLLVQMASASRNLVGISPRYQLTPQELRARIRVYCI